MNISDGSVLKKLFGIDKQPSADASHQEHEKIKLPTIDDEELNNVYEDYLNSIESVK